MLNIKKYICFAKGREAWLQSSTGSHGVSNRSLFTLVNNLLLEGYMLSMVFLSILGILILTTVFIVPVFTVDLSHTHTILDI